MNIEELKLILETVQGLGNSAAIVAACYIALNALVPLCKIGLIGYILVKLLKLVTDNFKVEEK